MRTRQLLAIPHLLGLDAGHPWWMTGALPPQQFPHNAPTGGEGGGAGAAGDGTGGSVGEPSGGTGTGGAGEGGTTDDGDAAKMREHLSAADRKREAAEKARDEALAKLKEIEDKDKSELEKTTERVVQLEQEVAKRDSELAKLRLENAFLTVNDIQWHDNEDALRAAEMGGYLEDVVKDGKVDQGKLKAKLKQLAEKKRHLVKATTGEAPPPGPSGAPLGSGQRPPNNNGEPDEAALKARYRSLRR